MLKVLFKNACNQYDKKIRECHWDFLYLIIERLKIKQ